MRTCLIPASLIIGLIAGSAAVAQPAPKPMVVALTLDQHRFTPAAITIPAGQRVQIVLNNHDPALEEFDSDDLGVEERVTPGATIRFELGPLKPGVYSFMGEFHAKTAQGTITAK